MKRSDRTARSDPRACAAAAALVAGVEPRHALHGLLGGFVLGVLVAGCSTTPTPDAGDFPDDATGSAQRPAREVSQRAAARSPRGGGYYLDDGPGDSPPPDLHAIPDAVPRPEPVLASSTRPYEVFGRRYYPMQALAPYRKRGVASWYGRRYHGNRTSSGEPYDMYAMTAAHPTLPLPSYARVTNLDNGRSVVVRVNDRGPFLQDRLIDLSYTAASRLGFVDVGSADVEVELITDFAQPSAPLVAQGAQPASRASNERGAPGPIDTAAWAPSGRAGAAATGNAHPAAAPATASDDAAPVQVSAAYDPARAGTMTVVAPAAYTPSTPAGQGDHERPVDPQPASRAVGQDTPERLTVQTEYRLANADSGPAGHEHAPGGAAPLASPPAGGAGIPVPALEQGYWLQLGAFRSAQNAEHARERLGAQLADLGASLDVVVEQGLFKVRAGPWPTREAAHAAARRVRAVSDLEPFATLR